MQQTAKTVSNAPDFLYSTAMQADKVNDLQGVEFYLRKYIALRPNSSTGYNALGYIFAERNVQLREALRLVEKANTLKPRDPYILDSLGWVYYRLKNYEKAKQFLESSLSLRYDAETVEHLLTVLRPGTARRLRLSLINGRRSIRMTSLSRPSVRSSV